MYDNDVEIYETTYTSYKIYTCRNRDDYQRDIEGNKPRLVYIKGTSICVGSFVNRLKAIEGIKEYEKVRFNSQM